MSSLSKILGGAGLALGAAALGGYFFPETASSITGGLFGAEQIGQGVDGSTIYQPNSYNIFGYDIGGSGGGAASVLGGGGGNAGGGGGSGFFSNPQVLSSAILAGTSLVSGLFGSDSEDKKLKLAENQQAFENQLALDKLALAKDELAQRLELAKLGGGGGGGGAAAAAKIQADTQKRIARAQLIGESSKNRAQAMQAKVSAREGQKDAAQLTGARSGDFFNQLIPNLQRGALRTV